MLDGYRLMFSLLRVTVDAYVWGDRDNPILVDVIGPYLKWGGDNSDAYYQLAPIDPNRTYRVTGNRGDAVYLSMTVYGGPDDGQLQQSDRRHDEQTAAWSSTGDGNFEFMLSPDPQAGAWLRLDDDAEFALTRDYLTEPVTGRRPQWTIEAIDPPARRHDSPADLTRRLRSAKTWLREQVSFLPTRSRPAQRDPRTLPGART